MNAEDFYEWMLAYGLQAKSAGARVSNCQTIERFENVDLDREYDQDQCAEIRRRLKYTTDDERNERQPLHHIPIEGNLRNGTATYKSALDKYIAYRDSFNDEVTPVVNRRRGGQKRKGTQYAHRDTPNRESYQEFFDAFGIDPRAICEYGLEHSVFAPRDYAIRQWRGLKEVLLGNGRLHIRMVERNDPEFVFYGRLYQNLFGNTNIEPDRNGNYYPKRNLSTAVGWRVGIHPDLETGYLVNYQTSHVLTGRTHNPLLYSAVWNIAFTPKLIDPFTGEEAHGEIVEMFHEAFSARVHGLFGECIEDYNSFVREQDIHNRIRAFASGDFHPADLARFKDAAERQWAFVD